VSRHRTSQLLLVVLAFVACTGRVPEQGLIARQLETSSAPGSGEPNLAVAPDGRVLLSWIEPAGDDGHRLRFSARPKAGAWSAPETVAAGKDWFVNWADFPSVAVLPDGTLFAHWLRKSGPGAYAYDVRVSTSRDGGRSWSTPVVPHRDGTPTEHGFVSMTPWGAREMGLVWLDGRAAAMSLVHTTLDADGRLGPETALDGRVCDCCQTDAAIADGATVVVYRDRSDTEVRDMSVVRFAGGRWSEPRPVAHDGWEIHGCPVNGPAIAAAGPQVAVAWFTAADDRSRVKVAFSSDSAKTFGAPIAVDDGRPLGRVDVVVLSSAAALVSWLEQTQKGTELRVRRVSPDGTRGEALTVADSSAARSSGFPRMVRSHDEVVLAWRGAAEPPSVRSAVLTGSELSR
jgi:BNR repeat-like domain